MYITQIPKKTTIYFGMKIQLPYYTNVASSWWLDENIIELDGIAKFVMWFLVMYAYTLYFPFVDDVKVYEFIETFDKLKATSLINIQWYRCINVLWFTIGSFVFQTLPLDIPSKPGSKRIT